MMKQQALKLLGVCFALFTIIITLSNYAYATNKAQYPIGEIVALEGDAYSIGDNGRLGLRQGDPIYFQTQIETGPDARAMIIFIDDTEVTIGGDASLMIDEYMFDPYDAQENKAEFSFMKGAFLWTSGMIAKKDEPDVTLNTPKGSIGIRGTTVWGGLMDDGYGVFVSDGLVNFAGTWGSAQIPKDKGVFIGKDAMLGEAPESWKETTLGTAFDKVKFRGLDKETLRRKIKMMQKANIKKRHDYRGRMFPYKENPFRKKLKGEDDNFFSDEFEDMRNRK